MIYLVGGAPCTGKSQLAQKFIEQLPLPNFSCDFLYDIDQVRAIAGFAELDIIEKGEAFYPILKRLLFNIQRQSQDCLIEGEVILPEHVAELSEEYEIRACFLGLSEVSLEDIITYGGHFNWPQYKLANNMEHEVVNLAKRTVQRSSIIKSECHKYQQTYFDLTGDYENMQAKARSFLLNHD